VHDGGDLSKEAARALVHFIMSMLEPTARRELRRELALAFIGPEPEACASLHPLARVEQVKRHPDDDR
jgi:hypothetical protein